MKKLIFLAFLLPLSVVAQNRHTDRLTPPVDVPALIQAALEAEAAPVTMFNATPYPGQCQRRSDLGGELFCWDGMRWLGELQVTYFTEQGTLEDNEYLRFNDNVMDVNEGFRAPFPIIFNGYSASWDNSVTNANIIFLVDNIATTTVVNIAGNGASVGVHVPFTAMSIVLTPGAQLSARKGTASNVSDPVIYLQYRRIAQ